MAGVSMSSPNGVVCDGTDGMKCYHALGMSEDTKLFHIDRTVSQWRDEFD